MSLDLEPIVAFLVESDGVVGFQHALDTHTALLGQCESYLKDAKTELLVLPFSPFHSIRNWREKRKDDRLFHRLEELTPLLTSAEQELRHTILSLMEKRDAVKDMAHLCHAQLLSCVDYTNASLAKTEPVVDRLRELVDSLTQETATIKHMAHFNKEIVKQTRFELRVQAQTPSWARSGGAIGMGMLGRGGLAGKLGRGRLGRAQLVAIRDEVEHEDTTDDDDSVELVRRLVTLRSNREEAMDALSVALESKETLLSNLENCIEQRNAIQSRAKLQGGKAVVDSLLKQQQEERTRAQAQAQVEGSSGDSSSPLRQREQAYLSGAHSSVLDPNWYSVNCHIVYLNAQRLTRRLDAYHELIMAATQRLQSMVEVRENMNNLNLEGAAAAAAAGSHSGSDSGTSSPQQQHTPVTSGDGTDSNICDEDTVPVTAVSRNNNGRLSASLGNLSLWGSSSRSSSSKSNSPAAPRPEDDNSDEHTLPPSPPNAESVRSPTLERLRWLSQSLQVQVPAFTWPIGRQETAARAAAEAPMEAANEQGEQGEQAAL